MSRAYEEERLRLHVQEALAEAIERSGLARAEVARRIHRLPSAVTQALSTGRNLTLDRAAAIAWGAGYRLVVTLEPLT